MCVVGVGCCVGTVHIQQLNVKLSAASAGQGEECFCLLCRRGSGSENRGVTCVCVRVCVRVFGSSREAKLL